MSGTPTFSCLTRSRVVFWTRWSSRCCHSSILRYYLFNCSAISIAPNECCYEVCYTPPGRITTQSQTRPDTERIYALCTAVLMSGTPTFRCISRAMSWHPRSSRYPVLTKLTLFFHSILTLLVAATSLWISRERLLQDPYRRTPCCRPRLIT